MNDFDLSLQLINTMCQNLSSGAILDGSKEIGDPIKLLTSDVDTWCRLVEEIGQN